MLPHLPAYVNWLFALTTLLTVWLLYRASRYHRTTLTIVAGWIALQGIAGLMGFYQKTDTLPPRAALLIAPPLVVLIALLLTPGGRRFLDALRPDQLTLLHTVRVPVELTLFALWLHHYVPQTMTFEGRNLDILSGLTAPVVYYFGYVRSTLSRSVLLGWNVVCLLLLLNIVSTALLAVPSPLRPFGTNVAVLSFPFTWLPSVVVPLVMLAHVATLRQLIRATNHPELTKE